MKITEDRLAVARAVYDLPIMFVAHDREELLRDTIESLPEPPDDSPATLPAPTGPAWATCISCGKQTERTEVACLDCQKYAVDLVRAPDVQAQEALLNPGPEVELARLRADYARRGVSLEHALKTIDEMQAQIDAAVAREREEQQVDAAAFRLLREEADAADAWHAETGMKVARPPRMSPATVKHIRDAEIRARSGARGV